MSLETIIVVVAAIEVIILVCFFSLCGNVSSIKEKLIGGENKNDRFKIYIMVGDIEQAKDLLLQMIVSESAWKSAFEYKYPALMDRSRKEIMDKYQKKLELVGIELNFEKYDTVISNL